MLHLCRSFISSSSSIISDCRYRLIARTSLYYNFSKYLQTSHSYFLKQFSKQCFLRSEHDIGKDDDDAVTMTSLNKGNDDTIGTQLNNHRFRNDLRSFRKRHRLSKAQRLYLKNDLENCLLEYRKRPNTLDALYFIHSPTFSFEQYLDIYKQPITPSVRQRILILMEMIDICSKFQKEENKKTFIHELVELLKTLKEEELRKYIAPNRWTSFIYWLAQDKNLEKEAIYWYNYIVDKGLRLPKKVTLHQMLRIFSSYGEYEKCRSIMNHLNNMGDAGNPVNYALLLNSLCKSKNLTQAMEVLEEMKQFNLVPRVGLLIFLVKICSEKKALEEGKIIHMLTKHEYPHCTELYNSIAYLYIACGHSEEAIEIFKQMKQDGTMNFVTWNCWIQAKISQKDTYGAIDVLNEMGKSNIEPSPSNFSTLISACTKHKLFDEGKKIYEQAQQRNVCSAELTTSIMNLYIRCGQPQIAITICNKMKHEKEAMDVETWNLLIRANLSVDNIRGAIDTVREMKLRGYEPNSYSFASLIAACTYHKLHEEGIYIIDVVNKYDHIKNQLEVKTAKVHFYLQFRYKKRVLLTLEEMRQQKKLDTNAYNCMIQAYSMIDRRDLACEVLHEMIISNNEETHPSPPTIIMLLQRCARSRDIVNGEKVVEMIKQNKLCQKEEAVLAVMIFFFSKVGHFDKAVEVFEQIVKTRVPNIRTWNILLLGYFANQQPRQALDAFDRMLQMNVDPPEQTLAIVLKGLIHAGLVDESRQFYNHMVTLWKGEMPQTLKKMIESLTNDAMEESNTMTHN